MSEFAGEKTEQPTAKRLDEAMRHGQFARSQELQTVFVLLAGLMALSFTAPDIWRQLGLTMSALFGHLHSIPLRDDLLQGYAAQGAILAAKCVGPVVGVTALAGLLAGALQNRFNTSPDVLEADWSRLNPISGLKTLLTFRSAVPGLLALVRLAIIVLLSGSEVRNIIQDPIFYTAVDVARIAQFLAASTGKIMLRVAGAMVALAAADYAYQVWRHRKSLMMTKQEVKDEAKSSEGNPEIKTRQKRLRLRPSFKKMLLDVPKADVVVTNPTHLAVALRYDRKTMKAPKVLAKGSRLNALRIRELAGQHRIPLLENKPLARLLFKYGKVGGEIPAQLYLAVAEVLAWVYRVNRYRYYTEQNHVNPELRPQPAMEER